MNLSYFLVDRSGKITMSQQNLCPRIQQNREGCIAHGNLLSLDESQLNKSQLTHFIAVYRLRSETRHPNKQDQRPAWLLNAAQKLGNIMF